MKILNFSNLKKYHNPKIFENQCPTIFGNSWSMNFSKFMVHEFFGIHGPWMFEIQCPTIFCDFGLFNRPAQAGGGGPYYMIFHYQKHTVLNYCHTIEMLILKESFAMLTIFEYPPITLPPSKDYPCSIFPKFGMKKMIVNTILR